MALKGVDTVLRNLTKAIGKIEGNIRQGLQDVAVDLAGKAARDAPVDTGDLRGSVYVSSPGGMIARGQPEEGNEGGSVAVVGTLAKSGEARVEIGFNEIYAPVQHERRDFHHPKGGKAGFLLDNATENAQEYVNHIAQKAKVN